VQKHTNADKLQTVNIDFQTVITGMDAKDGDVYVYFPVESSLNVDFLAQTNSFRDKTLNANPEEVGFFEPHGRVKALRLRGEKSMGYIVPASVVEEFTGFTGLIDYVGVEFDTIVGILLLKKYEVKPKAGANVKQGKAPKLSRLVEGQVHLHIDTENLRKNIHKINPEDEISITYKTHGTSWWTSHVVVKKFLSLKDKIAKWFGVNVVETEYDYVYGSRRVVKNSSVEDPKGQDHFYGYDLWEDIKNQVKDFIPKGFTLYGEALGFDKNGGAIQGGYDYGCTGNQMKLEVYRITQTNADGFVTELSYPQIEEFCKKTGVLVPSYKFYTGKAGDLYPDLDVIDKDEWRETFVKNLERDFNEKDCFMCVNKVPEEGIVLRKEDLFSCDSFKLKSFAFLEYETKELDKGVIDLESEN
jgi:hypothetical protein